jgi:hypothetical protein
MVLFRATAASNAAVYTATSLLGGGFLLTSISGAALLRW